MSENQIAKFNIELQVLLGGDYLWLAGITEEIEILSIHNAILLCHVIIMLASAIL